MSGDYCQNYTEKNPANKGYKQVSAVIRKRIGEFLILLIYLAIDAFEVWPHSHVWALSAVVAGIVALMLLDGEFTYKWIAAVGAIASIGAGATYWTVGNPADVDRPHLNLTDVRFAGGAPLQPGALNIEWRIINSGKMDAIVSEAKTTPAVITGTIKRLPETPIYMNAKPALKGIRIVPGIPLLGATPTDLLLTQEQVDGIKAGTAWLFYYGYVKYQGGEFDFIAEYNPQVHVFVRANDEFPAYSRAE